MKAMIDLAPDIALTDVRRPAVYLRFHDENTMINSASLGQIVKPSQDVRFVELAPEPCEALFERLAAEDPNRFVALIQQGTLEPHHLTFAAEAAGRIADRVAAVDALLPLLGNASALVREGAVYGLARHIDRGDVRQRLAELATRDPSPGVRDAAREALED
jgi:HEAT repeats